MVPAWYMQFVPGHHGAADRIGGLPTHLPPSFPISGDGRPLRFLAQFECDGVRLAIPGTQFLHVYQDDPEYGPWPIIVPVPNGAAENNARAGQEQPGVAAFDVAWEYREDPLEAGDDDVGLAQSKAGGTCYFLDAVQPGERLLLQLRQYPAGINFGGYTMVVTVAGGNLRVGLDKRGRTRHDG